MVLETTFAEAAANEDAALLEGLTATVNYEIPTFLDIGRQPYEAAEMAPLAFYPVVYVSNADHVQIMEVGNAADPWKVKAAMTAGPVGATILGDLEIPIIGGFANFTTLHLSQMGEGYQLEFSIVFPNDLTIAPVSSILFNVGPRPLGAKFGVLDSLIPNSDLLNVTFSIWDLGQDIAASPEVLGTQTWECSLAFSINVPVAIVGTTSATISEAGANTGVFEVKFEGSGLNLQFVISCESPETGRTVSGSSSTFIIFPGSSASTGLLRQTSIALMYAGPYTVIEDVVDAFNAELGSLDCEGCPASERKKRSPALAGPGFLNVQNLPSWYCNMPTSIGQDGECTK